MRASQNAIQAQQNQQSIVQGQQQPFVDAGSGAINQLWGPFGWNQFLGQTPQQLAGLGAPPTLNYTLPTDPSLTGQFQQSPGYQYNLQQQQQAIQNSAAGKTGALSGNMLQALQGNASGLANQDYGQFYNWLTQGQLTNYNAANNNYWNQYDAANQNQTNTFNRLFSLGQLGSNAAAGAGQTGAGLTSNIGNALIGQGQALASGQVGSANALASGIGGAAGSISGSNFNPLAFLFGQGGGALGGTDTQNSFAPNY